MRRRLISFLGLLGVVSTLLIGCGSDISREDYEAEVRKVRNRVDFALERIATAQTFNEVVRRVDQAGVETSKAAERLEEVGAPSDLDGEAEKLVSALEAFGDELRTTSEALGNSVGTNLGQQLSGLNFQTWNRVQTAFRGLQDQGIEVQPLQTKQGGGAGAEG